MICPRFGYNLLSISFNFKKEANGEWNEEHEKENNLRCQQTRIRRGTSVKREGRVETNLIRVKIFN